MRATSRIPGLRAAFSHNLRRISKANHNQPVLWFLILNGMPTANYYTCFFSLFSASEQYPTGKLRRQIRRQGSHV